MLCGALLPKRPRARAISSNRSWGSGASADTTDFHKRFTRFEKPGGDRQGAAQNPSQFVIRSIPTSNPEDLRRGAESIQQVGEVLIFCHHDRFSFSCRCKDFAVFGIPQTEVPDGLCLDAKVFFDPGSQGWGKLCVYPDNQAATMGWSSRRLAKRRQACISSGSRSGSSSNT